jgi:hypothetical protein
MKVAIIVSDLIFLNKICKAISRLVSRYHPRFQSSTLLYRRADKRLYKILETATGLGSLVHIDR